MIYLINLMIMATIAILSIFFIFNDKLHHKK
jgi:hypothetical protein